jgi:hypothetical protein
MSQFETWPAMSCATDRKSRNTKKKKTHRKKSFFFSCQQRTNAIEKSIEMKIKLVTDQKKWPTPTPATQATQPK